MFLRWTKVFLSYRRDDSAVHTRDVYTDLVAAFGKGHVFFDVKDIDLGDAFAEVIDQRIRACDVVVVVIGPQWLTLPGEDGQPRIRAPRDYVRHEIASALRQRKRLIVVAVGGASLPAPGQLPDEIAAMPTLNALVLSDRQLGDTANRLVDAIRRESATDEATRSRWLRFLRWLGVGTAVSMFFAAWLAVFDIVGLDTRTASLTIWLADVVAPVAASDQVQMVVIDRHTEVALNKSFKGNPAARRDHAALIELLSQAGARTVAFDLFVTTPSPADDAVLVGAIAAARTLNTAISFGAEDIADGVPVMLPVLRAAVTKVAMLCYGERLGLASTAPLASQAVRAVEAPGRSTPAQAQFVGIALAAAYPGQTRVDADSRKVIVAGARGIIEFPFSEFEPIVGGQRCQVGGVGDSVATAMYRAAPPASLNAPERRIAYETVLSMDRAARRLRFEGQSVLVGLMMPGDDEFRTVRGLSSEVRHGLELHADATGALLGKRVVQPVGLPTPFALMAGLGMFGSRLSTRLQAPLPRWLRWLALLCIAMLCAAGAVALCAGANRLLNLTYPVGALAIGHWLATRAARAH